MDMPGMGYSETLTGSLNIPPEIRRGVPLRVFGGRTLARCYYLRAALLYGSHRSDEESHKIVYRGF